MSFSLVYSLDLYEEKKYVNNFKHTITGHLAPGHLCTSICEHDDAEDVKIIYTLSRGLLMWGT